MNYRYFLFDLDGTLTDPGIGITNSVMYAVEKFQIEVSDRSGLSGSRTCGHSEFGIEDLIPLK